MTAPFNVGGDPDTYTDYLDHAEQPTVAATSLPPTKYAALEAKYAELLARIDEVIGDTNETQYVRERFQHVRDHHTKSEGTKR